MEITKAVRWRVSNLTHMEDIIDLLEAGEITKGKAIESIHMRITGNEPDLPKLGDRNEQ